MLTTLHSFCTPETGPVWCADGELLAAPLVQATNGNLYGMTEIAGSSDNGTIFEITPDGALTTLYAFCSSEPNQTCTEGSHAWAGLIQASNGNLYGTTQLFGTYGSGAVFESTLGGTVSTLYDFPEQSDCADVYTESLGALVQGRDGNFYGTTYTGGANCAGTIFKITPGGTFTTLYNFCSQANCADGSAPRGLIQATDGNFYGTISAGGSSNSGIIFKFTPGGVPTTLHSFCSQSPCADGAGGSYALVQASDGNMYGTTGLGGASSVCTGGCGTVFSLSVGLGPFVQTLPTSGAVGATVIILGTNLTGATNVSFNGTAATFTVVSSSEITTTIPVGATTGNVQVVTPSGTLTSNVPFLVSGASSTAPAAGVQPGSLTFGNQSVGTTSGSHPVTLSNTGNAALTITGIAPSANFGETDNCGGSVAASGSRTINVTFSPTASGPLTGTLTITDNSNGIEGSTQTVNLSGTGTGLAVSLSSSSLTFSAQMSGTSSAAQTVTLTNTGNASLTISGITASGDFSQTNTCGTTVSAGANCSISVTFKPTAGGNRTGTISISDNASGSPQSVALSGTGQDFTLAAPSGSSTSATAAPGQPATYTLSVGGEGGLSGTVTFTCTGAPSEATCTVSPNPATAGSSATNVTVTVTTTAASVSAPRSRPLPPVPPLSPGLRGLLMLALVLAAMAWAIVRRNQPGVSRWQSAMVPLASGLLLTLALAGCGGGGGGGHVRRRLTPEHPPEPTR